MSPPFRRAGTWLSIAALMVLICFFDSTLFAQHFAHGQWLSNAIMIAYFVWMYRDAPPRLRALMKYGVVVATVGEVFFSLIVGMYEYRLANVPIYVPPGHSILYGAVYYFVREPVILKKRQLVEGVMFALSLAYTVFWLVTQSDVYGALCSALFVVLVVKSGESRSFFLAMFLFVAFLEQVGTRFEAWYWHRELLDRISWIPSGNPPSGISVFYFGFDVTCLLAYLTRNKELKARYKRLKARQQEPAAAHGLSAAPTA
jgi:hypothetical protein